MPPLYTGDGAVSVERGNAHVKKAQLVGTSVSFNFEAAKLSVADTDLDGGADLDDVVTGDKVLVQARLSRQDPGPQPFAARKLVDQTRPPAEEDEEEGS
jgi:hypothetical protein